MMLKTKGEEAPLRYITGPLARTVCKDGGKEKKRTDAQNARKSKRERNHTPHENRTLERGDGDG